MKIVFAVRISLRLYCVLPRRSFAVLVFLCRYSNATVRIFFAECPRSSGKRRELLLKNSAGDECLPVFGEIDQEKKDYLSVGVNKKPQNRVRRWKHCLQ